MRRRLKIEGEEIKRTREKEGINKERTDKRIKEKMEEIERENRRKKIEESNYNEVYKKIVTTEIPEYLEVSTRVYLKGRRNRKKKFNSKVQMRK